MGPFRPYSLLFVALAALLSSPSFLYGQVDEASPTGTAEEQAVDVENASIVSSVTATDPSVDVDRLKIMVRPLTKEELEQESEAWMNVLRNKIQEVAETELLIQSSAQESPNPDLRDQLVELRKEETDIIERAQIVFNAFQAKGGDIESMEQYIAAVSDITETTDTTSFLAALIASVTNWIQRDDGGKLWLTRSITALVIVFIFWLISKFAGRLIARIISRHSKTSILLENFARRTTGGLVSVVGILTALSVMGVQIGPMLAALGAGGFIVGFAMQETLGSFASGMMIMVYRPFDVDDYICVAGVEGTVQEMSLVSTTLLTVDNKLLVIPNKRAWGDTIINFTGKDLRRVDLVFGIGYDDDIQRAMDVLTDVAANHEKVLPDPAVRVEVTELADSSVNLFCRPWVKTGDYWSVYWDLTRQVKQRFDQEGISIPFPQRDVHVIQSSN